MKHSSVATGLLISALCMAAWQSHAQSSGERQEPRVGVGAAELGATTERFLQEDGAALYQAACAGCHQPQGQGAYGAGQYPTLAANPRLQGGRYPTWIVLNGMGGMPAFDGWLNDDQIISVVSYIQSSFGNAYQTHPTPELVAQLRAELGEGGPPQP